MVNGINPVADMVNDTTYTTANTANNTTKTSDVAANDILNSSIDKNAAVYEHSNNTSKKAYTKDTNTIAKLKAEADEKTAQFRDLVEKLMSQQASTGSIADSIWRDFANGNFKATPEQIAQAQKDTADDGYWGVDQTSDRIFSFAKALSGGDPEKMDSMLEAFKKGYEQATAAWGKDLPDISSRTYDAVMKKFEDYKNDMSEE